MAELPTPELVENRRRSIAMLAVGAPALNRDEALEVLRQLEAALVELRRLMMQDARDRDTLCRSRARSTGRWLRFTAVRLRAGAVTLIAASLFAVNIAAFSPRDVPLTPAKGSPGCGSPAVTGATTEMLDVAGAARQYRLAVPSEPTGKRPLPLILNFHGARSNDVSLGRLQPAGGEGSNTWFRRHHAEHARPALLGTASKPTSSKRATPTWPSPGRSSTTPKPASASTRTASMPPAFRTAPQCPQTSGAR